MNGVRLCCMTMTNLFIEKSIERNMNLGLLTASNADSFFTSALVAVQKKFLCLEENFVVNYN